MKGSLVLVLAVASTVLLGCSGNMIAEINRGREADAARLQSEYAKTVNKLEMKEGNFRTFRRVTFYNVRLGETVFVCEGYCHVTIDKDRDVELVVKVGADEYLRHYLGQKQDITYFSEQLKANEVINNYGYRIQFNPKLWIPTIENLDDEEF